MKWDDYNIVMPGRVIEYFPATQTATVSVSGERIFWTKNDSEGMVERGNLYDVPVHTASGGGYSITMPIKEGDTCLMLFSQFGYDHWLWKDEDTAGQFANNPAPWLRRKFSNKDGLCMVGFNTIPRAIPNYSATDAEFRNSDLSQYISLRENGDVDIAGPAAGSLTLATSYAVTVPETVWEGNLTMNGSTHSITGATTITGAVGIVGALAMNGNGISGVANPTGPTDVVTKAYGDANYSGGGGGTVTSVFGRQGAVVAVDGDYNGFYASLTDAGTQTFNNTTLGGISAINLSSGSQSWNAFGLLASVLYSNSQVVINDLAPTAANQATRKDYVDGLVAGNIYTGIGNGNGSVVDPGVSTTSGIGFLNEDGTFQIPPVSPIGGYSYEYTFNSSTSGGDPGTGEVAGNNSPASAITVLYISNLDDNNQPATVLLEFLQQGDILTFNEQQGGNQASAAYLYMGGKIDQTTYYELPVMYVGGSANLSNNKVLDVQFLRSPRERIPLGGVISQAMIKDSATDYDTSWQDIANSVAGKVGDVILVKADISDYDGATQGEVQATVDAQNLGDHADTNFTNVVTDQLIKWVSGESPPSGGDGTVWAPDQGTTQALTNGDLTAADDFGTWPKVYSSTAAKTGSGKFAYEATLTHKRVTGSTEETRLGFTKAKVGTFIGGQTSYSYAFRPDGITMYNSVSNTDDINNLQWSDEGDTIMVLLDLDAGTMGAISSTDGTQVTVYNIDPADDWWPLLSQRGDKAGAGTQITANFGATEFVNALPAGYARWDGSTTVAAGPAAWENFTPDYTNTAYVDAAVANSPNWDDSFDWGDHRLGGYEITGDVTFSGDEFELKGGSVELRFWDTSDNLRYMQGANAGSFFMRQLTATLGTLDKYMFNAVYDGAVTLYNDGNARIITKTFGAETVGNHRATSSAPVDDDHLTRKDYVDGKTWDADDIVSGTFLNARISDTNVTQHEAALTITSGQVSGLNAATWDATSATVTGSSAAWDNTAFTVGIKEATWDAAAATVTASSAVWDTTALTVGIKEPNWDTAYGWGNWATGVNKTFVDALNIDADKLDGINSTDFMRSDVDGETFQGKFFEGKHGGSVVDRALLQNWTVNTNSEQNTTLIPFLHNDMAYLLDRGGSYTITGDNGSMTEVDVRKFFDCDPVYASFNQTEVNTWTDPVVMEYDLGPDIDFRFGYRFGISFGSASWRFGDVKVEVYKEGTTNAWVEIINKTQNDDVVVEYVGSTSAEFITKLRITLGDYNRGSSSGGVRINQIWMTDYRSGFAKVGFLGRDGGNLYGDVLSLGEIEATGFPVTGGSASEFLKGDGTLDSVGYLPLTGGVMSGVIDMGGNTIGNVPNPTVGNEVANKSYVDSGAFVNLTTDQDIAGIKTFTAEVQAKNADIRTFSTLSAERRLTAGNSAGAVGLAVTTSGDAKLSQYNAFGVAQEYIWLSLLRDGDVSLNSKTSVRIGGARTDGVTAVELQARNGASNVTQSGVEVGGTTSGVFTKLNYNTYARTLTTQNGVTTYGSHKFQPVATDFTTTAGSLQIYSAVDAITYGKVVQFSSSITTDQGAIQTRNGAIPKFVGASDTRLKKDIVDVDLEESMAKIEAVRVVDYTKMSHMWHDDPERNALCPAHVEAENVRGAIAQEYAEVFPDGVTLNVGDNPEESYYTLGIDHEWDLLNSVKYLKRENDSLKEMMITLMERIDVLEESHN